MPPDPNTPPTANPDDCVFDSKVCWIKGEDQKELKKLLELAYNVLGKWGTVQKFGSVSQDTLLKFCWAAGLKKYQIHHVKRPISPFFQSNLFDCFVDNIRQILQERNKITFDLRQYKFKTYTPNQYERLKICQDLLGIDSQHIWNRDLKELLNIGLLEAITKTGFDNDEISELDQFISTREPISIDPTPDLPVSATQVYLLVTCRRIENSPKNECIPLLQ